MKKIQFLSLLMILLHATTYGQQNCDELQSELKNKEEIIAGQKVNISKLENEISYYKEALNLLNSKIAIEQDDFILRINSVTGKSDNGIVIIEGLVENKGILRAFRPQSYKTLIYDAKGNNYKASEIKFGNLDNLQEFQKNLPIKFSIVFNKIGEEMPVIRNLTLVVANRTGSEYQNMIFKNLPVSWE